MNQVFKMIGMLCLVLLLAVPSVSAQSRKKKKDVDAAFNEKTMFSGLHLESGVSLSYNNGWLISVSPAAGYRLQKWLITGAGMNLYYTESFRGNNGKVVTKFIGPRVFAKANITNGYYGLVEYQYNTFKANYIDANGVKYPYQDYCGTSNATSQCKNKHESSLFIGGGITQNFGQGFGFFSEIMIDVLFNRLHSVRVAPYEARFGISYTFL